MVDLFSALTKKIYWAKPLAIILAIGFAGLLIYSIIFRNTGDPDIFLIPSVIGLLWSLLLLSFTTTFSNLPSKPRSDEKLIKRIKARIMRGFYYIIGLIFLVLTVAIIFLSLKIFGIWHENISNQHAPEIMGK